MEHDIGYMQVQMRLYRNDKLYEEFAINAFDECFCVKTELISSEHKAIEDPADENKKVVQVIIKVFDEDYTIAMLIPVHQSDKWEIIEPSEQYSVAFYCILGETSKEVQDETDRG